ncbi:phage tail protein [Tropicimonas sp. IMCC34043]|uniref:phage tail-collar fiber domain-containing protein n=1 Tax=Tropicimonas sp. IMCC34043 TaxID=2248760 RepID=UPI000E267FDC|nr:phage tail protein [Tropicimonas sp. IMCC34043]
MGWTALITDVGRNKEAAALANGTELAISEIAWGSGVPPMSGAETALANETGRKAVQAQGVVPGHTDTTFFEIELTAGEGPFTIREAGLFDADGELFAIACYDTPVYKPVDLATVVLRMNVVFSDLDNLVIVVPSSDAYVPVERLVDTGSGLTGGGSLAQNRTLAVDFATQAEADAGVVTAKAVSPGRLYNALAALAVKAGFSVFWGANGFLVAPAWLGGLVIQWCSVTFTESQSTVTAPWPIEFPIAALQAVSTRSTGTVALSDDIVGIDTYRTIFSLKRAQPAPAVNSWRIIAIGH